MPVQPHPAGVPSTGVLRPASATSRSLGDLADLVGVELPADGRGLAISGVSQAADRTRRGDLFVARAGARTHGARFATEAAAAGAVAALTDPDGAARCRGAGLPTLVVPDARAVLGTVSAWTYGEPARALTMLGVTGTNGKTTTTYLLDAALRRAGRSPGLVGTVETRVGDLVVASTRSTPEPPDLHALLALMWERGATAVSMEVSSHALALGRVDGVRFDVAAFTNLGQDHLELHGDQESYYQAKASLFTPSLARIGVVNVDDPYGARLAAEVTIPVVTVSPSGRHDAAWRVTATSLGPDGSRFQAAGPDGAEREYAVAVPGEFNVANAVIGAAMLHEVGIDPELVAAGFAAVEVPGRMERVGSGPDVVALVDYAHTPDAVAGSLAAARQQTRGRLVAVLGCGGDRDRQKRPLMGAAAASAADLVVVTDDNPRSEDPARIRAAVLAGAETVPVNKRAELREIGDRGGAIRWALHDANADDTVVVLGKGHEQGHEIAGVVHPFDDRAVVREVLAELRSS